MVVGSVEVRWYWWLGRQNKSPGSEGVSLPQFPCCGGTECPPSQEDTGMERRGVARAELGASPPFPVLHRLAWRLCIPSLEQGLLLLLF